MATIHRKFISGPRLLVLSLLFAVTACALCVGLSCAFAEASVQVAPAAPPAPAMPAFVDTLVAYAAVWVPILVLCLSSIATGLSNYPATAGAAAWIMHILGFLSFLKFKDQPGTMKIPFTPHGKLQVKTTALVLLMAVGLGVSASACSWFKSTVEPVATDVIDCAKEEGAAITAGKSVIDVSLDIIATITAAIESAGASDPLTAAKAAFLGMAAKYGEPIVACVESKMAAATAGTSDGMIHAALVTKYKFAAK